MEAGLRLVIKRAHPFLFLPGVIEFESTDCGPKAQ
jgi:hypothetical protein